MQASLRHGIAVAGVGLVLGFAGACAKGDSIDTDGDGDGGAGGRGGRTSADGPSGTTKTGISGPSTAEGMPTSGTPSSTTPTTTTMSGPATTTTNGPATTNTTTTVTTGGGVDCQPENPGPGCGAGQHCVPQIAGDPTCEAAGAGGDYALCPNGRGDCAPVFECVFDGFDACCMDWCQVNLNNCPSGETCTSFNTPVYIDGVEYGVCWDGYPCVL